MGIIQHLKVSLRLVETEIPAGEIAGDKNLVDGIHRAVAVDIHGGQLLGGDHAHVPAGKIPVDPVSVGVIYHAVAVDVQLEGGGGGHAEDHNLYQVAVPVFVAAVGRGADIPRLLWGKGDAFSTLGLGILRIGARSIAGSIGSVVIEESYGVFRGKVGVGET